MKFICDGLVLADAAITVSKACATKTLIPAYECIKISVKNDSVTLTAFDGEISIKKTMKAEVLDEGEVCVNGKFFSDFVNKVSDRPLVISLKEDGIKIHYGDSSTIVPTLPADEFPTIEADPAQDYLEVKQEDLKKLITNTVFCCATDDSRPILRGCLLEANEGALNATALDGFRMASSACPLQGGSGYLKIVCPARTLTEITRILEGEENLKLYVEKNMLSVAVGDTVLKSKLYLGEFVRKEHIFPAAFTTSVTVDRAELIDCVERAIVVMRGDKYNLIVLEVKASGIVLQAQSNMGNVNEIVERSEVEGKELKIALNGKYLLEALKALDGEKAVLSFNTPMSPYTVVGLEEKSSEYLMMPVKLEN
ncbi:MAG: DNA polymerase III subunit beta [Clostridia bacterium]|nr:DNA polymerase III subunit beta [Clostridia bacterium]